MKETYRGAEITYLEDANKWQVVIDGRIASTRDSLLNARKSVDDLDKVEKVFARHPALYREAWGGVSIVPCTVTSYTEDSNRQLEVWISYVPKHVWKPTTKSTRAKVSTEGLFEDTPENRTRLAEIRALFDAEQELSKKREHITNALTPYKIRK